jgi:hypothetical protein
MHRPGPEPTWHDGDLQLPALTASKVAWCSIPGRPDAGTEPRFEVATG